MISPHRTPLDQTLMASDRIFRPEPPRGLCAEWDDPLGFNDPIGLLREHHHRFRLLLESTPDVHPRAHSSIARGLYRVALYHGLGTSESITDAEQDLRWFATAPTLPHDTALILMFDDPSLRNGGEIEHQFWSQMMGMYARDTLHHRWLPNTHDDPAERDHSLSIDGVSLDLSFFQPWADRADRRFETPMLIIFKQRPKVSDALLRRARVLQQREAIDTDRAQGISVVCNALAITQ